MAKSKWHRVGLIALLFISMGFLGMVDSVRSVTMPLMKAEFGTDYSAQGMFMFFTSLTSVGAAFCGSIFVGRRGPKATVLASFLLMAACMVSVFFSPSFLFVTLSFMIYRVGYSFYNVGSNAMSAVIFAGKLAVMMNLFHGFYGLGSTIGPMFSRLCMQTLGMGWRQVFLVILALMLGSFAALLFLKMPAAPPPPVNSEDAPPPKAAMTLKGALREPMVWLFGLSLGFISMIEMAPSSWGIFYLQDVHGFDPTTTGATFLSLFFLLFSASRLLLGSLIEKVGYIRTLVCCVVAALLIHAAAFIIGGSGVWLIPISGLPLALLWPTLIAAALRVFGDDSGVASGAILAICPMVSSLLQLGMGKVNTALGMDWGYKILLSIGFLAIICLLLLARLMKKRRGSVV